MHIVENKSQQGRRIYQSILLRESYRVGGKVKKRTVANLSRCTPEEVAAIRLALKFKDDLTQLGSLRESVELQEGPSIGAVWTVYQVARELGIEKAMSTSLEGKLALWQVIARVIDQGSRLSAVRLATVHAACDVLDLRQGFDEDTLYGNLRWLAQQQERIEDYLYRMKPRGVEIFLYDVTSSYLEGDKNYFGAYGYNRDGKKGKKQIVIGLLCDAEGDPVSIEVFTGNTQDTTTFISQVQKVAVRFGCKRVTFVGDRGMIKSTQIEQLPQGFHYITAITKPQVESLMQQGLIQIEMFCEDLCEIEKDRVRYLLRRNPFRAEEIARTRQSKRASIEKIVKKKNDYLDEHPRARVSTAEKVVQERIKKLKADDWLMTSVEGKKISLKMDEDLLAHKSLLDGCYVIKTDLVKETAPAQTVHDRYKDLTDVERAFRTCKTGHLEVRPVFVQKEKSTRGHVLVVMLAYKIIRRLREAWASLNVTVEEGITMLSTLSAMEVDVKNHTAVIKIPRPRKSSGDLLKALNIRLPLALPHHKVNVDTRKKLMEQRKVERK